VRRFWWNHPFAKNDFVQRFAGSPDLYRRGDRGPLSSVNYVTCHDGFTLRDLVSYNDKHNEANGEDNRDGPDANYSGNCGVEGETDDAEINALRLRMQKNHLATLFLSIGVPMLLGGDEFGRTQRGNNNAYCQDNGVSWFDWSLLEANRGLFEFCKSAIRFRKENPVFARDDFFPTSSSTPKGHPGLLWLDEHHKPQTWSAEAGVLAGHIEASENDGVALYLLFNATPDDVTFRLPKGNWRVRINTAEESPGDFPDAEAPPALQTAREFRVLGRSLVVLSS
jgi:glycogen operon protein